MAVKEIQITVSQIENDLNNGMTWFKKDDQGYGSIQEKYEVKELDVQLLRKHPLLKDLETNLIVFKVIDDKNETSKTNKHTDQRTDTVLQQPMVDVEHKSSGLETDTRTTKDEPSSEAAAAFNSI